MSKNEVLEVVSKFMDSVVVKDDLVHLSVGGLSEDELEDQIEQAVSDYADRNGYASEGDVRRAIDDAVDSAVNDALMDSDFVERSDLEDYPTWDDLDDRIETVAVDHLDLVDRSEVESIVDDYVENHDFQEVVDDVINTYDWDYVFENADLDWDHTLKNTSLAKRLKALELKLTMYEILDDLDFVRR